MKKALLIVVVVGLVASAASAAPTLLPQPREVEFREGFFDAADGADKVTATVKTDAELPKEGYRLTVTPDGVTIESSDAAGAFYARQTLRQLGEAKKDGGWRYACAVIKDWPEYGWRGVLLDEGRHFFGKEVVRQLLDLMAMYKFNTFQWHLTEDQGWRLEIPGCPKLSTCGAMRLKSPKHGATFTRRGQYDYASGEHNTEKYGPFFYTADDVREIVAYAAERHITIVPEIEMPGHALAALGAYPEYACFPERINAGSAATDWGIFRDVFCVGNDETVRFLERVIDHVCELFPSKVIHIGGDECPRVNWEECPKCQARMKKEGLEKAGDLQAWLTRHMADYLATKGRRIMGWDEILAGDVPKSAIGQSWRTAKGNGAGTELVSGAAGAEKGHDMVINPYSLCYYSAKQGLAEEPFPRPSGALPFAKAYTFDPMSGVPESARGHILGGQCCLWAEYIWNRYDLAWRMWPRAFAMSEILWAAPKTRNLEEFRSRAAVERHRLISMGVNCAPFE